MGGMDSFSGEGNCTLGDGSMGDCILINLYYIDILKRVLDAGGGIHNGGGFLYGRYCGGEKLIL